MKMKLEKILVYHLPLAIAVLLGVFILSRALTVIGPSVQAASVSQSQAETKVSAEELPLAMRSAPVVTPPAPTPAEDDTPQRVSRYADLEISDDEIELLAKVIYLEARGEYFEGQQAVAEVILNRAVIEGFPNTVHDVLWEDGQFDSVAQVSLDGAKPEKTQYDAIDAALYGPSILPLGVTYFSTDGENRMAWGTIGSHVFCYRYYW